MLVSEVMKENPVILSHEKTIGEILREFSAGNEPFIISGPEGEILGILELDPFKVSDKEFLKKPVSTSMRKNLTCYPPGKAIRDILLEDYNCPILVMEDQQLLGVITEKELLTGLAGEVIQINELNKELEGIIESVYDGIYVTDGEGYTLRANKAFERNSGVKVDDVLGRNVHDLEAEGIFYPSLSRLVIEEKKQKTLMHTLKSGTQVLGTATPIFNNDGSIFRVITNSRNITELVQLKERLEESEELKNQYLKELKRLQTGQQEELIAASSEMKEVLRMADKIAQVDTTILILGETGVGKSKLAKRIHQKSDRNKMPFVQISCGAIPDNLLEAELFGYEGGAFTGASEKGKIGKFEAATGGSIFLDEIGELPLNLQVKLLQVLQENKIVRVGGVEEIDVDVRVMAATNKNLQKMIEEGVFREDLFFRLNVVPLEIPPLRERKADIFPLIDNFLKKFNAKYDRSKNISVEATSVLQSLDWKGNVRELENFMERLVVTTNEDLITTNDLPQWAFKSNKKGQIVLKGVLPLQEAKSEVEQKLIKEAYSIYKTTHKMAQALGVNQSTVVRKMQKYKIK